MGPWGPNLGPIMGPWGPNLGPKMGPWGPKLGPAMGPWGANPQPQPQTSALSKQQSALNPSLNHSLSVSPNLSSTFTLHKGEIGGWVFFGGESGWG